MMGLPLEMHMQIRSIAELEILRRLGDPCECKPPRAALDRQMQLHRPAISLT